MSHSGKSLVVSYKKLPTPDIAVGAITGAIKGYPDNRGLQSVIYHATDNMGMMMLHRDKPNISRFTSQFLGILGGKILRVKVVSNNIWLDAKQLFVESDTIFKVLHSLQIFHVTDVLT